MQDYCASKFGAIGFHESLSHELKAANKDGIKMTLVCPFLVDTGMFKGCEIRSVPDVQVLSHEPGLVLQLTPKNISKSKCVSLV